MEGGGNNPKLLCTIDTDKYSVHDNVARRATIHREVNNVNTLEIELSGTSEASQAITETSDIILVDTFDNIQEFHITEIQDVHSLGVSRVIYAELSIGELIDDMITAATPMPVTTNPADYLAYIMSFTRWTVGTVDPNISKSKWEENLIAKNCLEALNLFIKKYNCEIEVRYTVDSSNKITGRFIDVKKAIGKNIGKRFEYTKDINSLKRKMDLDNTKTAIYPRIAVQGENNETTYIDISQVEWSTSQGHPVDKPLGQVILTNPTISNMWKRYNTKTGKLQDRVMYAEWTGDTAKDANSLISQAWAILKANGVPDVSYEVTACDLYILTGDEDYAHERVGLGDAVVIIDKEFTPEIRIQTRVMEIEEDLLNPVNNTYVFGKTRENLATGAVNQQQSIEDKLASLASQVGNITIPEYQLPYQSGKAHYEAVKAASQDELIQSNGYVMIEDSDGLWVFDKPSTGNPTKATILKGGCMALATYDNSSSRWVVGTFINGNSVNADFITAGEMSGLRIKAGTIEANRLSVAAVEYVRTGLATEDDLNNAVQGITSVQQEVSSINNQIVQINKEITNVAQGTITAAKIDIIKNNLEQLDSEHENMVTKVAKVLANEYLPAGSSAMTTLSLKRDEYNSAYTAYKNYINTIIADNNVTEAESKELAVKLAAYNTATVNLTTAIEGANDAILANVYSKAREGLVTSAELKVNNDKVIIEAKKGMVTTGDMTSAIDFAVKDLVNEEQLTQTVNSATSNLVSTDKLTAEVTASKIEAIKQTFSNLRAEYLRNMKTADLLYADPLLTGTPKSNLNTAKSDYYTKYTAIMNAHNDITSKNTLTPTQLSTWNSAITAYQTASQTLSQRVTEAQSAINTAIADKAVDNISMGAKNILLKSGVEATNNLYLVKNYGVSELLVVDEEYTITVCITPAKGVTHILPYVSGGWTSLTRNLVVNGTTKQIVTGTFKFKGYYADKVPDNTSNPNAAVAIYRYPNDNTVTTDSTIHWAVLTRGNVPAADWIQAPQDIEKNIQSVIDSVSSLDTTMNGAFKDGVINTAEAKAIEANKKVVEAEFTDTRNEYNAVYANSSLTGTPKTNLKSTFDACNSAYNNLVSSINAIVSAGKVTPQTKDDYNSKYTAYISALGGYRTALQVALDAITVAKANTATADAKAYADRLKGTLDTEISEVNKAVSTLRTDVTTSIKDGIISEAEALSIKSNIKVLDAEKADIDADYAKLNANPGLTGDAKSTLTSRKVAYTEAHTALIHAITTAISDNNVSVSERNNIDSKFTSYYAALGNYRTAAHVALDEIAKYKVDSISVGTRNIWRFGDFEGKAPSVITGTSTGEIIKITGDNPTGMDYCFHSTSLTSRVNFIWLPEYSEEAIGQTYTFSCWVKYNNVVLGANAWNALNLFKHSLKYKSADGSETGFNYDTLQMVTGSSEWKKVVCTYTYKSQYKAMKTDIWCGLEAPQSGEFWITGIQMVKGNKIPEDWSEAPEDIDANIQDVADSVTALDKTMNGAFKDDVISKAEAKAIEANKNTLVAENADIIKEYTTTYGNANLTGSAKTNLASTYSSYTSAYNKLVSIIDYIVQAATVSPSNKSTYTSRYSEYTTALGNYRVALQNALTSIATVTATKEANSAVGNISLNSRNIAYNTNKGTIGWDWKTSVGSVAKAEIRENGISGVKFTLDKTGYNYSYIYYNQLVHSLFKPNTVYTIAMDVRTSVPCGLNVSIANSSATDKIIVDTQFNRTTVSNTWVRVYATATSVNPLPALGSQGVYISGLPSNSGATVEIRNLTVVEGNIDPGWSLAPEDSTAAINDAVKDLPSLSDVTTAQNNAVIAAKIETIKQTYSAIKAEYNSTYKQAETIYLNSYLQDSAKTNLNSAKNDYSSKFSAVTVAYNAIASDSTLSTEELQAWNNAVTNMQNSATTLGQRMQEAQTYINTAVYNASKNYTDGAIPDALTGYAKESYVDSAKQQAIADAKKGMVTTAQMEVNNSEILMTTASMGQYNLLRNTDYRDGKKYWSGAIQSAGSTGATGYSHNVISKTTWCMAGEKAMEFVLNGTKANGAVTAGINQDADVEAGVTYTLSFWIAGHRCKLKVQIDAYNGSSWISTPASKVITPKTGGRDRSNWTYDSVTFTCPSNTTKVKVHFLISEVLDYTQAAYMWVVKPMLCTGINAQAWSGHPSEIRVGVVSITEEEGLKVEHSDSQTYTTLTAGGLKVWEYGSNQPLASFGEGNTAQIGSLHAGKIDSPTVMPIGTGGGVVIHCSSTGSGNFSGMDSNNCAVGFSGAMAKLCESQGIPEYKAYGGFFLMQEATVEIAIHGSTFNENIALENIYGTSTLSIKIDANTTFTGSIFLRNIQCPIYINGNRTSADANVGAMIKRSGNTDGISVYNCSNTNIINIRINQTSANSGYGIYVDRGSTVRCSNLDIYNFYYGIRADNSSTIICYDVRGTCPVGIYGTGCIISVEGRWINASAISVQAGNGTMTQEKNKVPSGSLQGGQGTSSQTVSGAFTATGYRSDRQYSVPELIQAAWDGSGGYGQYVGKIWFNGLKEWLSNANNYSAQIYLQRQNTSHGYSTGATVRINGTDVGTLARGEGKWFNIPTSVIDGFKNGSIDCIQLNGTGNSYYIRFEMNSQIKVTATKTV